MDIDHTTLCRFHEVASHPDCGASVQEMIELCHKHEVPYNDYLPMVELQLNIGDSLGWFYDDCKKRGVPMTDILGKAAGGMASCLGVLSREEPMVGQAMTEHVFLAIRDIFADFLSRHLAWVTPPEPVKAPTSYGTDSVN